MKIFFTTPYRGKSKYQRYIDSIIHVVEGAGNIVISPEKSRIYEQALRDKTHYQFIRQGIAGADAVIIEASYEDFRVGHEATLGLMYGKPVLVMSQIIDYSHYISHEKFFAKRYRDLSQLKAIIADFLRFVGSSDESLQEVTDVVDLQHSSTLSKLHLKASQGSSRVADWARRAALEPDQVYKEILTQMGSLSIQNPWDVFAKIYNEDTPDQVFYGAVKFADKIFSKYHIGKADRIVDSACGTAAVSRLLTSFGYRQITAFDRSRAMLAEAYRLCAHLPSIEIRESSIEEIDLLPAVKGIIWFDFSSNFSLTEDELKNRLIRLVNNLEPSGVLIFDVRTRTGWNVDFFHQKVTIYETDRFQRIWINLPDYKKGMITFDIFIRVKGKDNEWLPWEREQMTERMWRLSEVNKVVEVLQHCLAEAVYSDDFTLIKNSSAEPGLAYIVLRKIK